VWVAGVGYAPPVTRPPLDPAVLRRFVDATWEDSIVPALVDYIRIPNRSPMFDPGWREAGHMDRAVALAESWCRSHAPEDAAIEVVRLEGRTPLLLLDIPGEIDDTVVLYGHLDKQPEFSGWEDGLGPWTPVVRGDRLYGRGGADDGYAVFASVTAIAGLRRQQVPHARCVVLIECCEESGSYDLPHYIEHLAPRIGAPSLVVCLDSGCGNYDQLWCTTSLRGMGSGTLSVEILREGVHSGDASGIVADSFRIARALIERIEDGATGAVKLGELHVDIPRDRVEQARAVAEVLGTEVWDMFPLVEGARPVTADLVELILNRTWRPTVTVTGAGGLPAIADAGNVLRPETRLKLSFRLPPTLPAEPALARLRAALETDPPSGAKVRLDDLEGASGWNAPPLADWLAASLSEASLATFGAEVVFMGEGGSIPFMGMLGERFPEAQFLITGVLGPHSNAHGPNEFLHLPTARRLTSAVAHVLGDHASRR
jgi:acetylornithine deacetylase/succinyl-diaminopimelate desuccinylase-like protein